MATRSEKSIKKFFARCIGSLLMIASISGCAGIQSGPAVGPPPPGARVKLAQADKSLQVLRGQMADFYADLRSVVAETDELRSRPYWSGFESILVKYPSLADPGKEAQMTSELKTRLSRWSRDSKVPWETVMRDYSQLADRCAILDMKRVAVRQMLISVQAAYMAVVMMEAAAGRGDRAHEIFERVEALDKPGAQLDSIRLNRLGLYDAAPPRGASLLPGNTPLKE